MLPIKFQLILDIIFANWAHNTFIATLGQELTHIVRDRVRVCVCV